MSRPLVVNHWLYLWGFSLYVAMTGILTAETHLAPLPIPLTSFGAAEIGGKLYVYGGHTGDAHEYYHEAQSNKLLMLDTTSDKSQWQELSTGQRLQGLGMVAYRDEVIILGGFSAQNKQGEKKNLCSSNQVRAFNTKTNNWRDLPALPEPRSSHDAAIIGSIVYVVGGWNMQGDQDTVWHHTAWSLDLSQNDPKWHELPKPPFVRRAMAVVAHQDKLFVIGGMHEDGSPTKQASMFDPTTKTWSDAGSITGEKNMAGFGAAAWSIQGSLIVSTYEGELNRWNPDTKLWEACGHTQSARFFHRLLPLKGGPLVAIGGANMESGKFLELESIPVK